MPQRGQNHALRSQITTFAATICCKRSGHVNSELLLDQVARRSTAGSSRNESTSAISAEIILLSTMRPVLDALYVSHGGNLDQELRTRKPVHYEKGAGRTSVREKLRLQPSHFRFKQRDQIRRDQIYCEIQQVSQP